MKISFDWKKLLPYVVAIAVFICISMLYCAPALDGKVLVQGDVNSWKGAAQEALNYKAETAAERLCGLCFRLDFLKPDDVRDISADKKQILAKEVSHGPCSQAPVIAERKMYGLLTGKR